MDAKHRGARAELIGAAWLLARGYEVFRNVSDKGDVDLVGIKPNGDVELFDVKTGQVTKKGKGWLSWKMKAPSKWNIKYLVVDVSTKECKIFPIEEVPTDLPAPRPAV